MASVRLSMDSFWKVGVKRGWWKGIKGGDVLLFTAGLAMINVVHDRDEEAVDKLVGKGIRFLRGESERTAKAKDGNGDGDGDVEKRH